jgi:sugar/nucleoside kinase (ribokinase family)
VLVLERGSETTLPGYPAERVLDPTGAGDAFAAGLAIALADGRPADDCARFANAVASFAVEGVGMESLADLARVKARMARRPDP